MHVVLGHRADVHAGGRTFEAVRRYARVLQRRPRHLEHEPLLRIHLGGFPRRDAKQRGVEGVDPVEERAVLAVSLARRVGIRIVVCRRIPAVRGHLAHGVDPVSQHLPARLRIAGATWEAAADADDRHRLRLRALRRGELGLELLDGEEGPLQRAGLGLRAHASTSASSASSFCISSASTSSSSRPAIDGALATGGGGGAAFRPSTSLAR